MTTVTEPAASDETTETTRSHGGERGDAVDGGAPPPAHQDLAARWADAESSAWPRRRWLRPWSVVQAAVMAALVAAVVLTGTQLIHDRRIDSARSSALAAATVDGRLLGTFRYQHINEDLKAMEQNSTAAFARQYITAQSSLTKLLTQYKANSVGSVQAVAVKSVSPHKAVVLAFINQAVTNTAVGSTSKNEPSRVIMTLVRPHGKWLISAVQIV